ncbi:MAG: hypothetical protein VR64_02255 [Desulfatitalea sp. BRH_c12]|nr:MAG: hypothetical protein VR64_02255 [Desulfatitalea sp. BRH_c12]
MLSRLKQYLLISAVVGAFYFLLSHHLIFTSTTQFELLKKQELTLEYTFFSFHQTTPEAALRIDPLREDGLGELLVNKGIITEEKLLEILRKIDS